MSTLTIRNLVDRLSQLLAEEPELADRRIFIQTKAGSLTNLEPVMETGVEVGRTKTGVYLEAEEDNPRHLTDLQTVAVIGVNWKLKTIQLTHSILPTT